MMMFSSSSGFGAIAMVILALFCFFAQVDSRVAMLCDYINLGVGTSCSGPLASPDSIPLQYGEAAYIDTRYESNLSTGASRFEYCKEYCNNNDDCLGFMTDPGNPDYTGTFVRCWISKLEPTLVYNSNDGYSQVESCQKKIVESCRAAPTPSPTVSPQDCQRCLDSGCTWCEARSSEYTSECKCRTMSNCTFFETSKKTSCDNHATNDTRPIKNFFADRPLWFWASFSFWLFVVVATTVCSCRRFLAKAAANNGGAASPSNNVHDTTTSPSGNSVHGVTTNASFPQTTTTTTTTTTASPFLTVSSILFGNNTGGNAASSSTDYNGSGGGGGGFTSSSNDYGGGGGGGGDGFTSSSGGGGGCDFGSGGGGGGCEF